MAARTDQFSSPDYFRLDELLTEEHIAYQGVRAQLCKKRDFSDY